MIDWVAVAANTLWIFGLSVLLAGFSYHYWQAPLAGRTLRQQLAQAGFQKALWLALVLIGSGLAGTSHRIWETAIWIGFALVSAINLVRVQKGTQ